MARKVASKVKTLKKKTTSVKAKAKKKTAAPPKASLKVVKAKRTQPKPTPQASVSPPQPNKVHPFARFMKGGNNYRGLSAQQQRFNVHDTYRKKAI